MADRDRAQPGFAGHMVTRHRRPNELLGLPAAPVDRGMLGLGGAPRNRASFQAFCGALGRAVWDDSAINRFGDTPQPSGSDDQLFDRVNRQPGRRGLALLR